MLRSRNLSWSDFAELEIKYLIAVAIRAGNFSLNGTNFHYLRLRNKTDSIVAAPVKHMECVSTGRFRIPCIGSRKGGYIHRLGLAGIGIGNGYGFRQFYRSLIVSGGIGNLEGVGIQVMLFRNGHIKYNHFTFKACIHPRIRRRRSRT